MASSPSEAARAPHPVSHRLATLSPAAADLLRRASQHLRAGQMRLAEQALAGAESLAPTDIEVRRTRGLLLNHAGKHAEARALIEKLLVECPDDPALLNDLGGSARGQGDYEAAFAAWRRACELQPDFAIGWFNLARHLKEQAWIEEALPALERTVELAPEHVMARVMFGDVLVHMGELERARTEYLEALRLAPTEGAAWWGIASIKTVPFSADELHRLESLATAPGARQSDRISMGYALAKAYEDHGRYEDAFRQLAATNGRFRELRPWNARHFSATVQRVLAAFRLPHAQANDPALGEEVIFIVSLPRSGSTLTEQILAAHPEVEGASELPDLSLVIRAESERRGVEFPLWVGDATTEDWARLGRNYLARTARWRTRKPRSTDKMPNNWFFVGAALAMLPGARIVDCRRDPVETCWSCYKQLFSVGNEFTCDLDDLATTWHDYDRAMRQWHALAPDRVREQVYETLVEHPEAEVRALLEFCGLPFDEACLRFHEASRSVRTASAAQVREPLRRNTARTSHYGALLDPLRSALARHD
jgi:tetratricopeptide (TPR) repeat protein